MPKTWIFDFDGTLVHSKAAITQCFESITKKLAPHRLDIAKHILIGPPLRQTVAEILGDPVHPLIDEFVSAFIQMHDEVVLNYTEPYPSAHETLAQLHQQGGKMAIATNKRLIPTIKILEHLNWDKFFLFVECSDSEITMRDKDQMIKTLIEKDSDFMDANFVGDTVGDGLSAIANRLLFIKANYGYGTFQDWTYVVVHKTISSLDELQDIVI
tara:strand:+ start:256 stop:894 length:639 start_codon:yes stop_codon:yes gene_type:complete